MILTSPSSKSLLPSVPQLQGSPTSPWLFVFSSTVNDHAYGSVILVRDQIVKSGKISTCHLSNSSACVALNTNNGIFRLASVYLRPSLSLPDFSSSKSFIFNTVPSPHSLICVVFNAKSHQAKERGSELERLLVEFKMNVANEPLTSFQTELLSSTLLSQATSLSDHPYLYFDVKSHPSPTSLTSVHIAQFHLPCKSIEKF
jgi:hypothetical protein